MEGEAAVGAAVASKANGAARLGDRALLLPRWSVTRQWCRRRLECGRAHQGLGIVPSALRLVSVGDGEAESFGLRLLRAWRARACVVRVHRHPFEERARGHKVRRRARTCGAYIGTWRRLRTRRSGGRSSPARCVSRVWVTRFRPIRHPFRPPLPSPDEPTGTTSPTRGPRADR